MFTIIAAGLVGVVVFCAIAFVLLARANKPESYLEEEEVEVAPQGNRRKEPRVPVASEFDLFWQDIDASHKSARARGIEMSPSGVSVRSGKPILCNSVIQIRGRQVDLEGKAVVRYCTRKGLSYVIGLELESRQSRGAGMRAG